MSQQSSTSAIGSSGATTDQQQQGTGGSTGRDYGTWSSIPDSALLNDLFVIQKACELPCNEDSLTDDQQEEDQQDLFWNLEIFTKNNQQDSESDDHKQHVVDQSLCKA